MPNVLRVDHASFSDFVYFTDDEVAHLDKIPIQQSFPQLSQTGSLSVDYAGLEHYRFEFVFVIAYRNTLAKLRTIANLQDSFEAQVATLEGDTVYTVLWPDVGQLREQLVRGRLEAYYELGITWEEVRIGTCPDALVGS